MAKLVPMYERDTGDKLLITYGATAQLLPAINKGEPVDVIIVVKPTLAEMAKTGKVVESSQMDIARSGVGIAIRRGSVRPDISTVEAFKKTLLAARSIAYTKSGRWRHQRHLLRATDQEAGASRTNSDQRPSLRPVGLHWQHWSFPAKLT